MKHSLRLALAALALALTGVAQAQGSVAFAAKDIHLRAGPGRDHAVVAVVPAGSELQVQGCVTDNRWCEVVAGGSRGWVYAGNIGPIQRPRVRPAPRPLPPPPEVQPPPQRPPQVAVPLSPRPPGQRGEPQR
jgi:hypothetical protein